MTLSAQKKAFGFTLIELLVAISIIAVLSTIGLVAYGQVQVVARDNKRMEDMREVQKAFQLYYIANGNVYPVAGSGSDPFSGSGLSGLDKYFQNNSRPSDPNPTAVGNYSYRYYKCSTEEKYVVCAKLENPAGKANRADAPSDGCQNASVPVVAVAYYCVGSQ